jgi:uncharacterized protein involved in exopolysaccharide biosynthesis
MTEERSSWSPDSDPQYAQRLLPYILRKYWLWFILGALLVGMIAGMYSLFQRSVYRSYGTIQINSSTSPSSLMSRIPLMGGGSALEDEMLVVRSREIGMQVIDDLGLHVLVFDPQGPDAPQERIRRRLGIGKRDASRREEYTRLVISDVNVSEDLLDKKEIWITADGDGNWECGGKSGANGERVELGQFSFVPTFGTGHRAGYRYQLIVMGDGLAWDTYRTSLSATPASEDASSILAVSFLWHNPVQAQQVVERVIELFLNRHEQTTYGDLDVMLSFIEEEIDTAENNITELTTELRQYQEQHEAYDPTTMASVSIETIANLNAKVTAKQIELRQLDYLTGMLDTHTPKDIYHAGQSYTLTAELQGTFDELGSLATRLEEERNTKTDAHPDVIALKEQAGMVIDRLREGLKSRRTQVVMERDGIAADISEYESQLEDLPAASSKIALLTSEIEAQRQILAVYKEHEATTLMQRAGTSIKMRLLDPPLYPTKRDKPKITRMAVLGLLAGFLLVGVVALFIEAQNRRFRSLRELRLGAGLRIIATLPPRLSRHGTTPETADSELFARIARFAFSGSDVLGISHPAGPEGGFGLAWGVAAGAGDNVLLIDADVINGSLQQATGKQPDTALNELAEGDPEAALIALDGNRKLARISAAPIDPEQWHALLASLCERFSAIIICLPAPQEWPPSLRTVLPERIVLSIPQAFCSMEEIRGFATLAAESGAEVLGAVITSYRASRDYLRKEERRFVTVRAENSGS